MVNAKWLILHLIVLFWSCSGEEKNASDIVENQLNFSHLEHLYKEVTLPNGQEGGLIHIYSNFPDYNFDIEPREGFVCVDDVARAIYLLSNEKDQLDKVEKMVNFVLYMQNKNGWFNNFVWDDLSINTTYQTSVAEPSWWTWRALWALEKSLLVLEDETLRTSIETAIAKTIINIKSYLETLPESEKTVEGISVANSLPHGAAADQASILSLGLVLYYGRTKDEEIVKYIRQLGDGIMKMQLQSGVATAAFLSWDNLWHAYGNGQSYALLKIGEQLQDETYTNAALFEINNFYHYLAEDNFAELLEFKKEGSTVEIKKVKSFPQIAYGLRPIVFACVEAYQQTQEEKYKNQATEWIAWLYGQNVAQERLYFPETGRCFDGIVSETEINKNSGAESTIEALLSVQKIGEL